MNTNNNINRNVNNVNINRRVPKGEKHFETLIIIVFTLIALAIGIILIAKNFSPSTPDVGGDIPFSGVVTGTDEEGNIIHVDDSIYTRKEGVYNFLLVGFDRVSGLTDVNMIAQIDTNTGALNIIQMPRDTYARYNEKEGSYRKINGALTHFDWDLESLANFLQTNLCIKIDFYGSIDLEAFDNIVDIIGGVELTVPENMDYDDPAQNLHIHLKKGFQTLNGEQAEGFVRFRHGLVQADIGRTNMQKIFMTAFIKKFKSSINVSTLTKVGGQMLKYANTNLGINEYVYFAKQVLSIDMNKINMMTLPGNSVREYGNSGTWYYVLSRSAMLDAVNNYLNVYTKNISDAIFDTNHMFTNPDVDYMNSIYNTDSDATVYTGDSVDSDGIYVPFTSGSSSSGSSSEPKDTTKAKETTTVPATESVKAEITTPAESETSENTAQVTESTEPPDPEVTVTPETQMSVSPEGNVIN